MFNGCLSAGEGQVLDGCLLAGEGQVFDRCLSVGEDQVFDRCLLTAVPLSSLICSECSDWAVLSLSRDA